MVCSSSFRGNTNGTHSVGVVKVQIVSRQELDLDLMLREGPLSAGLPLLRGDAADRQFPLAGNECHVDGGELFSNGMCDELTSRLPLVICYSE